MRSEEINVSPHFISDTVVSRLRARGFNSSVMTVPKRSECYQFLLLQVPSFKIYKAKFKNLKWSSLGYLLEECVFCGS